jgi:ligand-binding sensor domain-containing protein/signal transduction histidine kinase
MSIPGYSLVAAICKADKQFRHPAARVLAGLAVFFLLSALSPVCGHASEVSPETTAPEPPALRFTHLGLADGLSHADVRRIVRDSQGFMWFGTWLDGLNRYDGYTFKVYRHDSRDNRSLGFDNMNVLFEDRERNLWVGTHGGGLDRYDRGTDSFIHYRHRPGDTNSLPDDNIIALYEDETGTLWVGTAGGLSRFDRTMGTFFTYRVDPNDPTSLNDSNIHAICLDRRTGLLWVGTANRGVIVLDRSTGQFTQLPNIPNAPGSLSDNDVNHIYQDKRGNLWVCTHHGLNRWNPETKNFVRYRFNPDQPGSLGNDFVTAAYEDRAGRFWVATADGLDLLDRASGFFFHYRHDPNDPSSLSGNYINIGGLYEDDAGALWVATHDAGVSRLAGEPAKFATYRNDPHDTNSLSQDTVTALYGDQAGNLWIGTTDGLNRFDGRNFVHYFSDPKNTNTLSPGPVWAITESLDHQLWVGVNGGGVCRFDGTNFVRYRHDPANPRSLGGDFMYGLQPDRRGGLWISVHSGGLDYFDGRDFTHFRPDKNDTNSLPELYVGTLFVDESNCVWMGSAAMGLLQFDLATRKATAYLLDPERPHSKVGNWVRDINSDGTNIWVASYSGLFCFDLATRKFIHHYTEQDGMASSSVLSVQVDANGNVWATTMAGLSKLDVQSQTFRNYNVGDGLQSAQFCERSRTRLPDGRLCFGGVNGFNAFDPDKLPDDPILPPVVLTDFQLFNKPVAIGKDLPLKKAIHVADQITLRYDQEVFRLRFAALNFTVPQKNRYAYKLEGFDQEWRYTDASDRSATYTKLPPGNYTFRVKASNNDGVWNEQGASIKITIIPPWWMTWWFRSAALAALLLLAFAGYWWRIRSMHKRSQKLERQVAERTAQLEAANKELESFSYSVSHDLRAPLRSIDGFSRALLEDYSDKLDADGKENLQTVRSASQRMGQLIDDILRLSQINRSEMHWTEVNLSRLTTQMAGELKQSEPGRTVEFVIAPNCMACGDAGLLGIVLENGLGNAWKYTSKKSSAKIEFGLTESAQGPAYFIRDNGCGFDMKYAHKLFGAFQRLHSTNQFPGTGIGLASVQRVIHRHGGQVWIEGILDQGTTLYFTLPKHPLTS